MAKANLKLMVTGERQFERSDPRNNGVVKDLFVGNSNSGLLRKFDSKDYEQKTGASGSGKRSNRAMNSLVYEWSRPSRRSFQFIRWLRNQINIQAFWQDSIVRLRPLMARYLN